MVKQPPLQNSEEQILGEIETKIVGMQYHDADVEPGEAVNLEREPENSHDEHSVRVENGRFQTVGHLPRKLVSWLAPLLDSGKVRVDGCVPESAEENQKHSPTTRPLCLAVFLCKKGKTLLEKTQIHGKLDALHEVVRRAYEDIQDYSDAELILELADGCGGPATRDSVPRPGNSGRRCLSCEDTTARRPRRPPFSLPVTGRGTPLELRRHLKRHRGATRLRGCRGACRLAPTLLDERLSRPSPVQHASGQRRQRD